MNESLEPLADSKNQSKTILIVDDNPTNLGVMVDYLEYHGFTVLVARDGESGLEKVRDGQPDIILLDLMMPDIDGFETCRRLKADESTKDIPVIFMTALTDTEHKTKGFEVGAVDFVTKPIQQKEALARIENHLRLRALSGEFQRTNSALSKRANELEVVAEISAAVASILDIDELLNTVVDLTKKRFGLYHAHIYLFNEAKNSLELAAGAGDVGRQMVAEGWQIPLDREQSLVARAARTRQGVIVNDVQKDPGFLPQPLLPETRSEMAVPLLVAGRPLGVLDVQSEQVNHFTEEDVRIKTALAAQIAVALENAVLHEQTKTALVHTQLLYEISRALNSASTLEEILEIIITTLNQYDLALGTHHITLASLDVDDEGRPESAEIVAVWLADGQSAPDPIGTRFSLKDSAFNQRWITNPSDPVLIENVKTDNRLDEVSRDRFLPAGIVASVLLPLSVAGRWVGLLNINWNGPYEFSSQDRQLYRALMSQVAMLVESRQLFDRYRQRAIELEEMTTFLDSIVENIPTMLFIKEAENLEFVLWNKAGEDLLGYNRDEMIGKNDYDFFPKEEADFFIAKDRKTLTSGKMLDIPEEPIQTADKGIRYLHTKKVPIYGADGHPKYLLGISEDITDRKQVQDRLRQSEERYRALYTKTPALLHSIDEEGRIIDVSQHWLEVLGYERDEVIGRKVVEFLTDESKKYAETVVLPEFSKTGSSRDVHYRFAKKGGEIVDVLLSAIVERDQDDNFVRSLAVLTDVTEQIAAEKALREREEQFRTLVEHAPEGIFVYDVEADKFVEANQNIVDLLGYSKEKLLKVSWRDISKPVQAGDRPMMEYHRQLVQEALAGQTPTSEWTFINRSAEELPVELRLVHLPAAGRSLLRASVIDIRERKAAEAERERLLAEVQAAYRQYVQREWDRFLSEKHEGAWRVEHQRQSANNGGASRALSTMKAAGIEQGDTIANSESINNDADAQATIAVPLSLRGQVIGSLSLEDGDPGRRWTDEEQALIESVAEQLALTVENLRLFGDTQQRAAREKIIADITSQVWASGELEQVMQTAVARLGASLDASKVILRLGTEEQLLASSSPVSEATKNDSIQAEER